MTREGCTFVCAMPEGWDARTRLTTCSGRIIAAHPDFAPLVLVGNKWEPLT